LIHLSELTPGVDPKTILHEGAQLQLRILRIDAERRRLGLSLRQADEVDPKEASPEAEIELDVTSAAPALVTPEPSIPSLESTAPSLEATAPAQSEVHTPRRNEGRRDRDRNANNENSLLRGLHDDGEGELTAMAEAFRAAARNRSKDETEE
jgi:small subunit ribosomal protein S1